MTTLKLTDSTGRTVVLEGAAQLDLPRGEPVTHRPTIYVHPLDLQRLRDGCEIEGLGYEEIPGGIRVPSIGLDAVCTEVRPDVDRVIGAAVRSVTIAPTKPNRAQRRKRR